MRRLWHWSKTAAALAVVLAAAGTARAQYLFGQNKVVYSARQWKILSTPRLEIYYYPEEAEVASYVADFAERTCIEYETYFKHKFEQKIPLILYASHHDFKQTNVIDALISDYVGGFTEYLRGRVAIPYTGSMSQLRNVLRHELVHAFMNDKLSQVLSKHRRFNNGQPPLWFSEGLAEYVATWQPDTEARMFMRDLVVNDNLVELIDLWRIQGSFLMYKEGESLIGYVTTRFGDEVIPQLLENWWRSDRFEIVLQMTLGISAEDLNRDWKRFLKRRYAPAVMQGEWPEQHGIALTTGRGIHSRPAPVVALADSGAPCDFVFLSSASGTMDLVRARAVAADKAPAGSPPYVVETLARGGRNEHYESFPAFASGPEVHASQVAFTCKAGGRDALVLYDLERQHEAKRFQFETLVALSSPTWSPDGEQIAFAALDRKGWPDLYRVHIATGELERLTHDSADDRDPDWSHDGNRLAWSTDRGAQGQNGVYHIWTLDLASGSSTPLTTGTHDDAAPAWGPADESLLFGSDVDGANNVYLYEFAAHKITQVSFALGGLFTPQWTPDGSGFLACSFDNTSFNVFRFGLDRRRETPVEEDVLPQVALADPAPGASIATDAGTDWMATAPRQSYPSQGYRAKFGLDYVRTAFAYDPDFASAAGAQLGFTDMLGNHQVSLFASNGADSFDQFWHHLNIGLTYTNQAHRVHWSTGAFHLTSNYDAHTDRYRWERRVGGLIGVAYPLSRFRRLESTFIGRVAQLEPEEAAILGVGQSALLLSNYTSFVHDNTMWSYTGPVEGTRFNVTAGYTFDMTGTRRGGTAGQIDWRHYVPLPGRTVLAGRATAHGSWGPDLQYFYLGGPFDLRGYRLRSLFARRTLLTNAELRFPLLDRLTLGLPFHNLEFGGFRGALFSDAAYVGWPYSAWYGSIGMGFEMWLGPGFLARFDVGRTHDFDHLASDNFTHFFIGWDY